MEEKRQGRYTVVFENPPLIRSYGAVVGQKESEGPLGCYFDTVCEDPMMGQQLGRSRGRASICGCFKGFRFGFFKAGGCGIYFCRRFVRSDDRHIFWTYGASNSPFWALWRLFNYG